MSKIIYINDLSEEINKELEKQGIEVLKPEEVYNNIEKDDSLIVLCELSKGKDGNNIKRTDFYGIKLVQELRRKDFKGKVLFVSFMPKSYFLNNKLKYGIVAYNRGHGFLSLPATVGKIKKAIEQQVKEPDYLTLRDVKLFGSDIAGAVSQRLHALSSMNLGYEVEHKKLLQEVFDYFQRPSDEVIKEYDKLDDNKTVRLNFVKTKCKELLEANSGRSNVSFEKPKYNWKVLWLDDELEDDMPLVKHLKQERNIEIILAKTYEEAVKKIEEDSATKNELTTVMVDYRLEQETDEGIELAGNQGYHFIEYLIKTNRPYAILVYSGMPRRFLMESFNQYARKIRFYSKMDFPVYENSTYLADEIVTSGDNAWLEINNQPSGAAWEMMHKVYFEFKNSVEFESWNRNVNFLTLLNLNKYHNEECPTFKITTSTFNKAAKKLNLLKEILLARRFVVGVLAKEYIDNGDLVKIKNEIGKYFYICFSKNPDPDNQKKQNEYTSNIFNRLALRVRDFPVFLLPEEYTWLKYDSGLDFDPFSTVDEYFKELKRLKTIFSKAIEKSVFFKSYIKKDFIEITESDITSKTLKNEFASEEDKIKYYLFDGIQPQIRTATDVKLLLEFFYNKLDPNDENYKNHLSEFVLLLRELRKFAGESKFTSFKSLSYFIDELPAKTSGSVKNTNKEENILNEYIRLFTPWELIMPNPVYYDAQKEYEAERKKRKEMLISSCQKKVKSKWEVYKMIYEAFSKLKETEGDNEATRNKAIYLGIIEWKQKRNSKKEKFYEKSKSGQLKNLKSEAKDEILFSSDYFNISERFAYSQELENLFIEKMNKIRFNPKSLVEVFIMKSNDLPETFEISKDNKGIENIAVISFEISDYPDSIINELRKVNILQSNDFIGIPLL